MERTLVQVVSGCFFSHQEPPNDGGMPRLLVQYLATLLARIVHLTHLFEVRDNHIGRKQVGIATFILAWGVADGGNVAVHRHAIGFLHIQSFALGIGHDDALNDVRLILIDGYCTRKVGRGVGETVLIVNVTSGHEVVKLLSRKV